MTVAPGGLAGAMGALQLDLARTGAGAVRTPVAAKPAQPTPPVGRTESSFESGFFQARAVAQSQKAQGATPPPNPNLPRGSVVDLKV